MSMLGLGWCVTRVTLAFHQPQWCWWWSEWWRCKLFSVSFRACEIIEAKNEQLIQRPAPLVKRYLPLFDNVNRAPLTIVSAKPKMTIAGQLFWYSDAWKTIEKTDDWCRDCVDRYKSQSVDDVIDNTTHQQAAGARVTFLIIAQASYCCEIIRNKISVPFIHQFHDPCKPRCADIRARVWSGVSHLRQHAVFHVWTRKLLSAFLHSVRIFCWRQIWENQSTAVLGTTMGTRSGPTYSLKHLLVREE